MANRGVDPDQRQSTVTSTQVSTLEQNEVTVANTAERETLMVFRSFTPQEFDPETGLTPAGKEASNVLNGVYGVRMVTHSFSGGEFTQRLQGIRDININLRNVDLFAELRDQPEDVTEDLVGPRASIESIVDAQGGASIVDVNPTGGIEVIGVTRPIGDGGSIFDDDNDNPPSVFNQGGN